MAEALPEFIALEVVTPDRLVVREKVDSVTIPGKNGYLGILPGHAPLLSELEVGELTYVQDGKVHFLAVCWGFAEVLPERVTILAQTAEAAEEIDITRAEEALKRAQERLKSLGDTNLDLERARLAVLRALTRLQVARNIGR